MGIYEAHLEDHPTTCKWLVTMVINPYNGYINHINPNLEDHAIFIVSSKERKTRNTVRSYWRVPNHHDPIIIHESGLFSCEGWHWGCTVRFP